MDLSRKDLIKMDSIFMVSIEINNWLLKKEKIQRARRKNSWNPYKAKEKYKSSAGIMKKCFELEPKTYQYASIQSRTNVELTPFFLSSAYWKKNWVVSFSKYSEKPQYLGKKLSDEDGIFDLAVQKITKNDGQFKRKTRKNKRLNVIQIISKAQKSQKLNFFDLYRDY